ncbi:MAG: hypothetical protein ACI30B_03995 [Paludibacteraceae bacterium]
MGLITNLLFPKTPATPPLLTSILPHQAVLKIESGILPFIQADKIVLAKGENCHYVEMGAIITEEKHFESKRDGASFRLFDGCYYHAGESRSDPVYEEIYTKGILFITNKRVVFHAPKHSFDQKITKLTAVTPYTNAITMQFGSKIYTVLLQNGELAEKVLKMVI